MCAQGQTDLEFHGETTEKRVTDIQPDFTAQEDLGKPQRTISVSVY